MKPTYTYVDQLKIYIESQVKQYVEDMQENHPNELRTMNKERLIYNLTDRATAIVRQGISDAIKSACYELLIGVRLATQHAKAEGKLK